MRNTFTSKPADHLGVLPITDTGIHAWDVDHGIMAATGGCYSSADDLSIFLRALMTYKLLSPAETHRWMKPAAYSGLEGTDYGLPWEVQRLSNLTVDGRSFEFYNKRGTSNGYNSYFALVDEFNVGLTILAAGPDRARNQLVEIVWPVLVKGLDEIVREETGRTYGGRYVAEDGSEMVLGVDEGAGLRVQSWTSRGKEMFGTIVLFITGKPIPPEGFEFRVFPTGVEMEGGESWRATLLVKPESCFYDLDLFHYGKKSLFELIFIPRKGGLEIHSPALRIRYFRKG